ncbi:MAG: hypothetical protein LBM16_01985 [Clostridiales bacterium]|jgi:Gpi18-like mannosyltransferase|nr:hypothetical protein [Clostridiales bacterium]
MSFFIAGLGVVLLLVVALSIVLKVFADFHVFKNDSDFKDFSVTSIFMVIYTIVIFGVMSYMIYVQTGSFDNIFDYKSIFGIKDTGFLTDFAAKIIFGKSLLVSCCLNTVYSILGVWLLYSALKKWFEFELYQYLLLYIFLPISYFAVLYKWFSLSFFAFAALLFIVAAFSENAKKLNNKKKILDLLFSSNARIIVFCGAGASSVMFYLLAKQQSPTTSEVFTTSTSIAFFSLLAVQLFCMFVPKIKKFSQLKYYDDTLLFISVIVIHWLILFVGYCANNSDANVHIKFIEFITDKLARHGDSEHYIHIAQFWYETEGDKIYRMVFFPLYPALIKIFSFAFGYLGAALFISNVCLGLSAVYLRKIVEKLTQGKADVFSVALFVLAPYGFFFTIAYTESIFFFLSAACIYYSLQGKFFKAGIFGGFAALSRMFGILLICVMIYEYFVQKTGNKKKFDISVISFIFVPLGLFIYLLLNKIYFGEFFKFLEFQKAEPFYNSAAWIGDNIKLSFNMGKDYAGLAYIIYYPQLICYFFVFVLLIVVIVKKARSSVIIYTFLYSAAVFTQSWLISGSRYFHGAVTIFALFYCIENKYVKTLLLYGFALFALIFGNLFAREFALL